MADIQVRIKLNAGVDVDKINSVAFNQETNNVSKAVGSTTTKNDGQNLISWGEDGLISLADGYVGGANSTLSSQGGYNGFVFGVVPENKMYSVEVTLEGSNIDSVTFYGDKNANQFPTRAIVNGEYIYSDDAEWAIVFPTSANSQTITFDMWNRANYNACFTHIVEFDDELVLDKRWIKSVESLSQSTGQPKEIYYGITPSRGNIEILDVNGEIKDYIQDAILEPNNLPISIYANGKQVHHHISGDGDYNLESKSLNLPLTNSLSEWDNIQYNGYQFSTTPTSLLKILKDCLNLITTNDDEKDEMLDQLVYVSGGIEIPIKNYLDMIICEYPYLKKDSLRNSIDKICQVAQLNVYKTNDNKIKFISSRPISREKPIMISKNNMFSNNFQSIILKNKYNGCEIEENKFSPKKNTSIYNSEQIYCADENRNFIGNDYGVNDIIYDVYGMIYAGTYFFVQFNFSIDLKEISSFIPLNLDTLKIKITKNNRNYFYKNGEYSLDTTADTTNEIYLQPAKYEINHHEAYTREFNFNVYNANISNGILNIRCQTEWSNFIGDVEIEDRQYNKYFTDYFTFSILKTTYENTSTTISLGENRVNLPSNELMQDTTTINSQKIINYIYKNIVKDYSNGVEDGNVTIGCANYYKDGTLVKNWENGEIINVGDIITFDNARKFKITSANFRKTGVPFIDINYIACREYNKALVLSSMEKDATIEFANSSGVQEFPIYEFYEFDDNTGELTFQNEMPATSLVIGRTYYMNRGIDDALISYTIKSEVSGTRMTCTSDVNFYDVQ